ncbi:hypothetical protein, partial [uncultured Flavonifractor sp.]|uniref:hypothetical protein n=1 Tax=uncultured Flavonifractor sp. TaxID=1193534 RepID=UPI0025FB64E4
VCGDLIRGLFLSAAAGGRGRQGEPGAAILLFKRKFQTPLLGKIALLLATLCFGAFTYFAFLMPENGLPAVLFA